MANNQYANRVEFGNTVVMDITDTTATSADVLAGKTFYAASGEKKVGTLFSVGSLWATDKNIHPASVLGFGEWTKIRESPFTWLEAGKHTWAELKESTWEWEKFKPMVYVWIRTA